MIGCCTKCSKLFDTTEEDACTPGVLCVECYRAARAEPDYTCRICGGSGGGPDPALACRNCNGTGEERHYSDEDDR